MKWNVDDLKSKLEIINNKIKKCKSNSELIYLLQELKLISFMMEYLIENNPSQEKRVVKLVVPDNYKIIQRSMINNFFKEININFEFLRHSKTVPCFYFYKKYISDNDFLKLIEEFLDNFDFDLKSTYIKLRENSHINISNKTYFDSLCLGVTNSLPSFNEIYIDAYFKNDITSSSILPHELGHAFLFENVSDEQVQMMTASIFREAFPIFVELAFIDYLKKTNYYKSALNMEYSLLDRLFFSYEFISNHKKLLNPENIKVSEAEDVISRIVAYYFIYLYRNNLNYKDKINEFINNYRNNKEKIFWDKLNIDLLINSCHEEFKQIYKDHANINKNTFIKIL